MRLACWITKVTDTDSEYLILTFPRKQCLRERIPVLYYTFIVCLVRKSKENSWMGFISLAIFSDFNDKLMNWVAGGNILCVVIFSWSTQNMCAGVIHRRLIIPHYIHCDLVYPGGFVKRDVSLLHLQHCSFCTEYKANKVDELLDGPLSLMWLLWKQSGTEDRSLRKSHSLFFPRNYFSHAVNFVLIVIY